MDGEGDEEVDGTAGAWGTVLEVEEDITDVGLAGVVAVLAADRCWRRGWRPRLPSGGDNPTADPGNPGGTIPCNPYCWYALAYNAMGSYGSGIPRGRGIGTTFSGILSSLGGGSDVGLLSSGEGDGDDPVPPESRSSPSDRPPGGTNRRGGGDAGGEATYKAARFLGGSIGGVYDVERLELIPRIILSRWLDDTWIPSSSVSDGASDTGQIFLMASDRLRGSVIFRLFLREGVIGGDVDGLEEVGESSIFTSTRGGVAVSTDIASLIVFLGHPV